MNITLPTLDVEQQAQLDAMLAKHNQETSQGLTAPEYLAAVIMGILNEAKRRKIEETGRQLIDAARQLSDADRLDFTAKVAALLDTYTQL
jgi:hypothetical protein